MSTLGRGHRWDGPLWRVFLVSSVLAAAIFGSCLWLVDQVRNDTQSSNLLAALFYVLVMSTVDETVAAGW